MPLEHFKAKTDRPRVTFEETNQNPATFVETQYQFLKWNHVSLFLLSPSLLIKYIPSH